MSLNHLPSIVQHLPDTDIYLRPRLFVVVVMRRDELASLIDSTLLRADATPRDVEALCVDAMEYGFRCVCVNPVYVALASRLLRGSGVGVCTVVGFPLGATLPEVKAYEAARVIEEGADEVDMVMNVGALKAGNYELVLRDIRGVVEAAHQNDALVKVIIEAGYLTDEEKVAACKLAQKAGADFVKTSTGFGPTGATIHDVRLMRKTVGDAMGVKAAGGIRTLQDALAMIEAGANRIGTSRAVDVIRGLKP